MDCKYNVIYKTPGSANYGQGYGLEYENGSSGIVYQNDIAGMAQGINDFSGSWISSNGPYDNNKNNRITNCNEGLFLYQQSTAILGTTPNTGGQWNSIYGNVYNVYLVGNSVEVYAYGNWWGSYPPNTSLFAGTIFYDYSPLNYDPWRGIPLHLNNIPSTPVIADNKSIDVASTSQSESGQVLPFNSTSSEFSIEPLLDGIALLNQNRYNDAKNFFLSYLSKHPDNQSAYVALYNCYNKETAPDITKYFSSLPPQAAKDHKFLLSNLYLKQGKVDLAKGVNNSVIHDNPNTSLSERGKLNKMYIALDIDNNIDSASAIFTDVLNSPNLLSQTDLSQAQERIETYAATRGKAKPNFKMQGGTNNSIPTTISLNNFPNPFNPTTNISYQLIENSRVSIKVYDILGRQVATLVDGNKAAGQYITVFDGSRYASGIYFVRMMVQGSSAQQIVKTLKIQMLK
jgi:tetratricopeptide (TPR) repeat protein